MERVIKFLISFWGGFKIYNTCCGRATNFLTQYFKDFSAKYSVN